MNTNLVNIIKRIVYEKGENILSEPKMLNPLFKDYAKDESKEEREAFGRCIEIGAYNELKTATSENERKRRKATIANQLYSKTGKEKKLFLDSLDILEAVVFKTAQNTIPISNINKSPVNNVSKTKNISKRTVAFGVAGALGGGIGTLITEIFITNEYTTNIQVLVAMAIWAAFIGMCISIGLLVAQSIYQKKKPEMMLLIKTTLIGFGMGAISGAIAQFIYGSFFNIEDISYIVIEVIRALCWGIMGIGVGLGVSLFVPNYPKKRAIIAGFVGGFIGSIFFIILANTLSEVAGRFIGLAILGFFIGFTISIIEEVLREAWLTVIWIKNETRTISLGNKPIIFNSSAGADIYISKDTVPPVNITVQIENYKVVMYDKQNNQRRELQNGERIDFGKVSFVVNVKK
jgi:hypothetical protein